MLFLLLRGKKTTSFNRIIATNDSSNKILFFLLSTPLSWVYKKSIEETINVVGSNEVSN